MAAYATLTDLLEKFEADEMAQLCSDDKDVDGALLQLTVDAGDRSGYTQAQRDAADLGAARLQAALDDAQAEVDTYLEGRYTLPLDQSVPVLTIVTCDVARFYLYDDRVPETVDRRYGARVSWLKDVASGRVQLGVATPPTGASDSVQVSTDEDDRLFTFSNLSDY